VPAHLLERAMSTGASHTPVNQADVAGSISSYYGVMSSDSRIQQLLGFVLPDVERMAATSPKGGWKASVNSVIQKYDALARELGLSVSPMQRDIQAARHANVTDANFAGALGRLGWDGLRHYAMVHGASGDGGSGRPAEGGGARASAGTAASGSAPPSLASMQQASTYGRMSGTDFAAHLGFHGDHARQMGALFANTSGAFRQKAEEYKRVMGDPNATPEQKKAAAEAMQKTARTKKEKETARKFQETIEKMKSDGVNLSDPEAIKTYREKHPEAGKVFNTDSKKTDDRARHVSTKALDNTAEARVKAATAAAPSTAKGDQKKSAKQATVQVSL
jgi:hypothetical protein